MSNGNRFRRSTQKLPCRTAEFSIGSTIGNYRILGILSVEKQKTVFRLDRQAVLCVRHTGYRLPEDLLEALRANTPGLVQVLEAGTIRQNWYTIDRELQPLPPWNTLTAPRRKTVVAGMAKAVNALHDLGYCHNDIKPEHFGLDGSGQIRLIDLDSAARYFGLQTKREGIEYTAAFAAPEQFFHQFGTASDYYSLAASVIDWGGLQSAQLTGWLAILQKMRATEAASRPNYTQLCQTLRGEPVERESGPRTYKTGVQIGGKTAYSRKQTALYLSDSYADAVEYCRVHHKLNGTPAASVARLIRSLDSTLPLYWYGTALDSSAAVGRAMSSDFPRMNSRMTELLRSGVLLEYRQFQEIDESVKTALKNAVRDPEKQYWQISRSFGGRFVPPPQQTVPRQSTAQKRTELTRLIRNALKHGDPVVVASILHGQAPTDDQLDGMILRLRAVPLRDETNLTNIREDQPFHPYIETRLPEPGQFGTRNDPAISDLFPADRMYLIPECAFREWKASHTSIKRARSERRKSVFKALGWTALSAGIAAALPFIIAGVIVVAVIILVIGLLLG